MKTLLKDELEQVAGGCVICNDPTHDFNFIPVKYGIIHSTIAALMIGIPVDQISRRNGGPIDNFTDAFKFVCGLALDKLESVLPRIERNPNFDIDMEMRLAFV